MIIQRLHKTPCSFRIRGFVRYDKFEYRFDMKKTPSFIEIMKNSVFFKLSNTINIKYRVRQDLWVTGEDCRRLR